MDELDYVVNALIRHIEEYSTESLREVIEAAAEELAQRERPIHTRYPFISSRESFND